MNIDSLSPLKAPEIGSQASARVDDRQPASEPQVRERKDTLELSSQAQEIRDSQRDETLGQIQAQINAGFFNRPEVIRETASRISSALSSDIREATL